MHWVNLGLPPGNNSTHGSEQDLNRLGFWLGAAAQSNGDQGPDIAPPESDLLTAEYLGERVARVTQQFARGRLAAGWGDHGLVHDTDHGPSIVGQDAARSEPLTSKNQERISS
jgi:hypothetical protein